MLTIAIILAWVLVATSIVSLLIHKIDEGRGVPNTEEKNIIDDNLTPAPDLCTWISKELEYGKVTFSLHTYGNLEGSNVFGSFNVYKNWEPKMMARELRYRSGEIVKQYNNAYIISQANWDGPHQLDR